MIDSTSSENESLSEAENSHKGIIRHVPSRRAKVIGRHREWDSDEDSSVTSEISKKEYSAKKISNFDELPTDDSEEDSESDDGDSDSDEQHSEHSRSHQSDRDDDYDLNDIASDDIPLGERMEYSSRLGRFKDCTKQQLMAKKMKAIQLATCRLKKSHKFRASIEKVTHDDGEMNEDVVASKNDDRNFDDDRSIDQANLKKEPKVKKNESKKKKSKHAPTEMSSKRRDFFARGKPDLNSSGVGVSIGANKYKPRDPRMVSLSGHFDAALFDKRYAFLEQIQNDDIDKLRKRVTARKTAGKKGRKLRKKLGISQGNGSLEKDQDELQKLSQMKAERQKAQIIRSAKQVVKKKIHDDVVSGKRGAYYLKRKELHRMEMEAKFEAIRKHGGDEAIEKAINKRRKKMSSKNKKFMPP